MGHRRNFICEKLNLKMTQLNGEPLDFARVAHSLLVITDVTKIY